MQETSQIQLINQEINRELANKEVGAALLATTFKGLNAISMKQAIMEGMIRGFKFENFLQKDVYALPFKDGYSLVTSIDFSRKRGMRSGIVGKEAPVYVDDDKGKIVTCSVTVKRKIDGYVGDFTATVYFSEYYKAGKNGYPSLWDTKPRTMIAKVAEMHALRMACPEELAQDYIEEEMEKEVEIANRPAERIAEAKEASAGMTMGNLMKDEKNKSSENKDKFDPAESSQIDADAVAGEGQK